MPSYASMLPSTDALKKGLTWALRKERLNGHSVILLDRELSPYSTSFPCEVVTCQIGKGRPHRLFCKYTAGVEYTGHGHRGRVEVEVAVYRDILARSKHFRPKLYGSYTDRETGDHWIFLEYLDGSLRIGKVGDISAILKAARWIARFQAANQRLVVSKRLQFLKRYDRDYYVGWVRRTSEFAGSLHRRYPWLRTLCRHSEKLLAPLLGSSPTVIHGEYYPHNILYRRGLVCPVDWESAAIAEGVIDIATLTEGWPEEVVQACMKEYQRTRWPGGVPAGFKFKETLMAASLYMCFRWLGDEPSATHGQALRYFRRLRSLGRQLGVV